MELVAHKPISLLGIASSPQGLQYIGEASAKQT